MTNLLAHPHPSVGYELRDIVCIFGLLACAALVGWAWKRYG
jgi:hypothetical protein